MGWMEGYQCSAWDMIEVGCVTAGAASGSCYKRSAEDCCQDCNSACQKSLFFLYDQYLILAWLSRKTARKHKERDDRPPRWRQNPDDLKRIFSTHRPVFT